MTLNEQNAQTCLRERAFARALDYMDCGAFFAELSRLVSIPSESQDASKRDQLERYLNRGLMPLLQVMGFETHVHDNPDPKGGPILLAQRIEDPKLPTVLSYGHGDVIAGMEGDWAKGLTPFRLMERDDKLYGRGAADNKAQHLINLRALEALIAEQGFLGFNVRLLIETSEEIGSPGLKAFCETHCAALEADVFIASDGPRLRPEAPTLFGGARGSINFDLRADLRASAHHSGNFGGLLTDPTIVLAHAIATITDVRGQIRIPEWRPTSLTPSIQNALANLPQVEAGFPLDSGWGEERLTMAERVFGWNSFAVLAMVSGNPDKPQNAIPGWARATCQLRFVVGTKQDDIVPALRRHLDRAGFGHVAIVESETPTFPATRLDPDNPWLRFAAASIADATGKTPDVLPNLGGSLPNDVFADVLGLPTIWVPHSYAGSNQHAPNEHVRKDVMRESLLAMTGLFVDLSEYGPPV